MIGLFKRNKEREDGYRALERKKVLMLQDKQSLSDLMTWGWFIDRAGGVYETTTGVGVIFEVAVPSYMGDDMELSFETLFREKYPDGTIIDFFCFASNNIKPILDVYESYHQATPNVDHPEILKEIVKSRVEYYHKASKTSLWDDVVAKPRWFRNYISFWFPYEENDPEQLWRLLDALVPKIKAQLAQMGLSPRQTRPEEFLAVMREIFNPDFEGIPIYDLHKEFRRQIIQKNTTVEIDTDFDDYADIKCYQNGKEHYIRVFSITGYPDRMTLWDFNNILFPYDRKVVSKLPYPFGLSMSIRIGEWEKTKEKFKKKAMWNIHQADNNPLAKFFPKISQKAQYSRYVLELLEDNKVPVEVTLGAFFIAPNKDQLEFYSSDYETSMKRAGFELTREIDASVVPALMEMLPLNHIPDRIEFLKKYSSMFDANACALVPLIGGNYGTETPATMYIDRKMQLSFFDLFNSKTNYNMVKVAESGGGKSVSEADFHIQHLSMGRLVRVIDIGWSYKPLCDAIGGEYIELDDSRRPCFNPFTNVITNDKGEIEEDELETLVPLIGILCGLDVSAPLQENSQDNILSRYAGVILRAIENAWNNARKSGRDPREIGLREVADEMLKLEDISGEGLNKRLYEAIYPYSHGQYARYWNGRNNISYTKDYVILEMEQLEQKENRLKGAILFSLITKVLQEFFLGWKRGDERRKILIVDEAWSLLKAITAASFMEAAARRFRKYQCSLVVITQSIQDLYQSPTTVAIYENAAHLVMLQQKPEALNKAVEEGKIHLSPIEEVFVRSLMTEPGKYSEMCIKSNITSGVERLILDKLSYWLTTTNPKDKAIRNKIMKEYGLSMFEAAKFLANSMRIGEVLIKLGYINERQLDMALKLQGFYPDKKIGEILVEMGALKPEQVEQALKIRLSLNKSVA